MHFSNVSVSVNVGMSRSRLGLKIKHLGLGPQGLVYIPVLYRNNEQAYMCNNMHVFTVPRPWCWSVVTVMKLIMHSKKLKLILLLLISATIAAAVVTSFNWLIFLDLLCDKAVCSIVHISLLLGIVDAVLLQDEYLPVIQLIEYQHWWINVKKCELVKADFLTGVQKWFHKMRCSILVKTDVDYGVNLRVLWMTFVTCYCAAVDLHKDAVIVNVEFFKSCCFRRTDCQLLVCRCK